GDAREWPDEDPDLRDLAVFVVSDQIGAFDRPAAGFGLPEAGIFVLSGELVGDPEFLEGVEQHAIQLGRRLRTPESHLDHRRMQDDVRGEGRRPGAEIARLPGGSKWMDVHGATGAAFAFPAAARARRPRPRPGRASSGRPRARSGRAPAVRER